MLYYKITAAIETMLTLIVLGMMMLAILWLSYLTVPVILLGIVGFVVYSWKTRDYY